MNSTANDKPEWALNRRERERAALAAAGLWPRPKRRWPRLAAAAAIVAVAAAGFAWNLIPGTQVEAAIQETETIETAMQLVPSEILTVEPRNLRRTVRVSGPISPKHRADIAAEVAGRIDEVLVRPGDAVSKGDVIVRIDVKRLGIQLEQQRSTAEATRAQLELAESSLKRTEALAAKGLAPASGLEEARSGVEQLKASLAALIAQVDAAELSLAHATVVAPIDGIVASRTVDPGQSVAAGGPLLAIVDLNEMEAEVYAPVRDAALVRPGQAVELDIEGVAGQTFPGQVDRINPVAAEGTRSLGIHVTLDNPEENLRGGMFATGRIVVEKRVNAIAIPAAAVRADQDGDYVFKIEDGRIARQEVAAGAPWEEGRIVEIVSGLAGGEVIVISPLDQLNAGSRIEMIGG